MPSPSETLMQIPMRSLLLGLLLCGHAAFAKPWQGIEPGESTRDQVISKFGEPQKVVQSGGTEILAYLGDRAIKGTSQAQFKIDSKTKTVQRIDVFPGPVIDKEAVENSYGKACPAGPMPAAPCYLKKVTDDFRTYFHYPKLGLAIFFNEDGKTVNSFIFQPNGK